GSVGVAGGLGAHRVGDREDAGAALAGQAHRGERVGRLAGLGDPDHEIVGADDGVAVAVLGGDVHLDRYAGPLFDRVAADQAGVVGGPAAHDHDPAQPVQDRLVEHALLVEVDPGASRGAP